MVGGDRETILRNSRVTSLLFSKVCIEKLKADSR